MGAKRRRRPTACCAFLVGMLFSCAAPSIASPSPEVLITAQVMNIEELCSGPFRNSTSPVWVRNYNQGNSGIGRGGEVFPRDVCSSESDQTEAAEKKAPPKKSAEPVVKKPTAPHKKPLPRPTHHPQKSVKKKAKPASTRGAGAHEHFILL